ncbi:MAG TPA: hypothetical protein VK815_18235 [Candidatus Acidoferrales bacterium]|nr:hypothetical protein [Candidatus Acidoferrales bacterium]
MNLAGIKNHFTNWRGWEMNPIVIKELRQGVRSWTVTGMLLLFLVVLFVTSIGFLLTQSFEISQNMQLGGSMFSAFMVILAGASIFFIPLYTGVRVAAERQANNPDLLYVSTLSPFRIIFGKFLCSAYIAVLFFSACMPFMAFTNLLRGVDLPTVFFILFFLFLVVCAANMIAIFLACLPASLPFKILFALGGLVASFLIIGSLVGLSFEFMRSGVGAMMTGKDFWVGTATTVGIGLMITGLFFVLSVALISPPSANRALPVRLYLTAIWLIGGIFAFIWVVQTGEAERLTAWTVPTFLIMMPALLVVISNEDQLSLRVRRTIPQSPVKRFLAFFFYNGAAGGVLWVGGILAATYSLAASAMVYFPKKVYSSPESSHWFATTAFYAFAYGLTALFIQRKFFPRRPAKLTGLLAVLLAGGWAIAPGIVLFFVNQLSWKSIDRFQPGNIFNVFSIRDEPDVLNHEVLAGIWLLVMIVVNARWLRRQILNFQPAVSGTAVSPPPVPR